MGSADPGAAPTGGATGEGAMARAVGAGGVSVVARAAGAGAGARKADAAVVRSGSKWQLVKRLDSPIAGTSRNALERMVRR